jgi:tetratricopeptide (TPR) repeat protein
MLTGKKTAGGESPTTVEVLPLLQKGEDFFSEHQYSNALSILEEAELRLLNDPSKPFILLKVLLLKAKTLEKLGRWDEAIEELLRALPTLSEDQNSPLMGDIYLHLGNLYAVKGHVGVARKMFDRALQIYRKNHSPIGEAKVFNSIAALYFEQGEMEKALKFYALAYRGAVIGKDNNLKAILFGNLGILFSVTGMLDKALICYRKGLEEHRKNGDLHGISQIYHNLGMAMKSKGKKRQAIGYFKKSLALSRKLGARNLQAITSLSLGEVLISIGKLAEAKRYIEQALPILEEQGDNLGIAEAWKLKGILLMKKKKWKEAERALIKSATLFKKFKNPLGQAETYRELGMLYYHLDKKEKTWEWLEQSFELFQLLNASLDLEGVRESLHRLEMV